MDKSHGLHYVAWDFLCTPKQNGGWGLQSTIARIGPIIAKFAWSLIENPNSLLNRNLIAKYGEKWWKKEEIKGGSSTRKIINSGWKVLKTFVRWIITNGSSINVLNDVWILDKNLLHWPTFVKCCEDENTTLDYFIENGSWDLRKLEFFFGEELVKIITRMKICSNATQDEMELKLQLTGKSLSALLIEDRLKFNVTEYSFTWIHKLKLNARVELFLWRLCRDAIPTEEFLFRRKIPGNNLCPMGCGMVENRPLESLPYSLFITLSHLPSSFHSPSSLPPFLLLPSLYRNNPLTRLAFDADLFPLTRSALVAEDSLGSGDQPSLRKILPAHEIGPRCGKGVKLQGKNE
ncbi:hypothetical protein KFK09_011535 [Dendrobium nobile]|uniref:Reverse transcriptase zinc-binding domain-containing protein n=1 Tax=Dendrobium nobile TaxID=94219 RepID=A0A8T3BEU5_DENNO|nr:hypothetical protein KFK09_011535 [Dendrobium nobile]